MSASEAAGIQDAEVQTGRFAMGRGEFARAMMTRFGMRWWGLLFFLVVAGAVAAAVVADLRWLVVALMLAFIVAPMVAAFLYFSFGLRKDYDSDLVKEEESEPKPLRRYSVDFSAEEIGRYTVDSNGITVAVNASSKGFVRLPFGSFGSEEEFRKAVEIIGSYHRGNEERV